MSWVVGRWSRRISLYHVLPTLHNQIPPKKWFRFGSRGGGHGNCGDDFFRRKSCVSRAEGKRNTSMFTKKNLSGKSILPETNGEFTPENRPRALQEKGSSSKNQFFKGKLLLMAEILHHLGCMKPYK